MDGAAMRETDTTGRSIGGLSARMDQVEARLESVEQGLASILAILNQARGGWRVVLGICAAIGGAWGFIEFVLKK